jgi:hypothetical protein
MNEVGDGLRIAGQLSDLTGGVVDSLTGQVNPVAAEVTALSERYGVNSTALADMTGYARRLEGRLTGGARIVTSHLQATALQDPPTSRRYPTGPTGLGTSAARLGHRSQIPSSTGS